MTSTMPVFPDDIAVRIASEELTHLRSDLEHNGLACIDVSFDGCEGKAGLMERMAEAVRYPDPEEFGANWDALADMLMDLGWMPAEGYGLVMDLRGFDVTAHHGLLATLADVLRDVRTFWKSQDMAFVPFYVLD